MCSNWISYVSYIYGIQMFIIADSFNEDLQWHSCYIILIVTKRKSVNIGILLPFPHLIIEIVQVSGYKDMNISHNF